MSSRRKPPEQLNKDSRGPEQLQGRNSYNIEEILAEYRVPPGGMGVLLSSDEEEQEEGEEKGRIVNFPGTRTDMEEPPEEGEEPESGPRSRIESIIQDIGDRGERYADQLFAGDESVDLDETQRLERLIPGTDQEDYGEEEEEEDDGREEYWDEEEEEDYGWDEEDGEYPEDEEDEDYEEAPRRKKKGRLASFLSAHARLAGQSSDPPAPDASPRRLAHLYAEGLQGLALRRTLTILIFLISLLQVVLPYMDVTLDPPFDTLRAHCWIAAGLMLLGTLLSGDLLMIGLSRAVQGRFGMEMLLLFACIFTTADGVMLALQKEEPTRLPLTVVVLGALAVNLHGTICKRNGMRISCKTAGGTATPYRVTLDRGKWNGRDTYTKWNGTSDGFGSGIQSDDGAQLIFRKAAPLFFLVCIIGAPVACWQHKMDMVWAFSCLFTVASAYGASIAYGRSSLKVAQRLTRSGAALAGWPGLAAPRRGCRVLITDSDLFPPGSVTLNGYKVLGDFPRERVVAYTATIMRDSGSPLTRLFHDQLRALGGLMRTTGQLTCYEGGGFSAFIRGDRVLVGSAAFMNLMEIPLPHGLNVRSAVFCAINGELAGIFALNYALPDTVLPSLEELMRERIGPVLATRDFNLIPAMLQQRFRIAADKMDFPPVERRRELSSEDQEHDDTLTAVLSREGLFPFAEAVTSARRLRRATISSAMICCLGSGLGLAITAYLTYMSAYGSLSPLNLLFYMVVWLLPVLFLSSWVHRF